MCNKHVWEETDVGNECPIAGCSGKRRDENGVPFEEVIHFPLKPRLEALVRCESYCFELSHETWRHQSPEGIVAGLCYILSCPPIILYTHPYNMVCWFVNRCVRLCPMEVHVRATSTTWLSSYQEHQVAVLHRWYPSQ